MTDKQIRKECSFKGECQMMGCLNDENCYIKQLFEERYRAERELYRKEQECEALREEKAYTDMACEHFEKQLEAKEQECEELKERLNCNCFDPKSNNNRCISYNRIAEDYERDLKQLDQLKAENEKLDTENKRLVAELANPVFDSFEELDKLKQTLTEIKEIAEETSQAKFRNNACIGCAFLNDKILQKISEVVE